MDWNQQAIAVAVEQIEKYQVAPDARSQDCRLTGFLVFFAFVAGERDIG